MANLRQQIKYIFILQLSFEDFAKYLQANEKISFQDVIYPKIKDLAFDAVKSVYMKLDPYKVPYTFELLGLDFMVDQNYKPWLIEINTNPCLEVTGLVLGRIIPQLIE